MMLDYPKWVKVDGPGHPEAPGQVLVNNADEEREALASNKGPDYLNPGQGESKGKAQDRDLSTVGLGDMSRSELIQTLIKESITDDVADEDLRKAIEAVRERGGKPTVFGGKGDAIDGDVLAPPGKDAAGDERAPDPADLANGKKSTDSSPDAKAAPAKTPSDDKGKAKASPGVDQVDAASSDGTDTTKK